MKNNERGIAQQFCFGTALIILATFLASCHKPEPPNLTLSIAASLKDAMVEVEASYNRDHATVDFRNNFGASGILAGEIEQGAPVDVFFSAASKPLDELTAKGFVAPGTRHDLLRNELVLIAPIGSRMRGFEDLTAQSVKVIALGDPGNVPAGQYGRQTLQSFHLYDKLTSKFVLAKDVRQVLTYVETGNADAGLVYTTDAQTSSKVTVVAVAPVSSHDPIVYPVAVIKDGRNSEIARAFVDYLGSQTARAIFIKHGFTMASS